MKHGGSIGIAIACGLLVWSYQDSTHLGSPSHWLALAVIGGAIYLFASRGSRTESTPEKKPGKDLDLIP